MLVLWSHGFGKCCVQSVPAPPQISWYKVRCIICIFSIFILNLCKHLERQDTYRNASWVFLIGRENYKELLNTFLLRWLYKVPQGFQSEVLQRRGVWSVESWKMINWAKFSSQFFCFPNSPFFDGNRHRSWVWTGRGPGIRFGNILDYSIGADSWV